MGKRKGFKRILLIQSPKVRQFGIITPPLGILYLAAFLKSSNPGVVVEVIDQVATWEEAVKERISLFKPDLVGISVLTPARHRALNMAKLIRKKYPKCKILLGGVHPTLMWQQMMENYNQIDFICCGEGELTLNELVQGKNLAEIDGLVWRKTTGEIIKNKEREPIKNLDTLPFPAWEMIDPLKYPSRGEEIVNGIDLSKTVRFPVIFSRGCMGACTFCSSWKIWRGYRSRSGKNVADEIEFLVKKYKAKHFYFCDDTLTGSRNEIIKFCQEVLKRRLKIAIFGSTRVDLVDYDLLNIMKKAGFYQLFFGIESGSDKMLAKINKRTGLKITRKAIKLTKQAGIKVCALMMYGLPGESENDRKLTQKLLEEVEPDEIGTTGAVWIFPGTALYEKAKAAGLLNDRFWLGKRPYYIYRGGLDGDPIFWSLRIKDFFRFILPDSVFKDLLARFYLRITARKND